MESIIVTVTNTQRTFLYDLELPTDLSVDKLKADIAETLNGYVPDLSVDAAAVQLYCNRTGKYIADSDTLDSAGVWNGDYITIAGV